MPQFETIEEAVKSLSSEKVVGVINAQLTAHAWNSAFEGSLAEAAVKAGHAYLTEKNEKSGKDVVIETDAQFLKRVEFKVDQSTAQTMADGIAYPPETRTRSPKVDAFTQVATTKVDAFIADGKLDKASEVIAGRGHENDGTREGVIAAYANWLRSQDDLA